MKNLRIMVVGATGLLGPYLVEAVGRIGRVLTSARRHADVEMDLTKGEDVKRALKQTRPDILIHAAALTDVDLCQKDPERAFAVNHKGTQSLAESLPEGARMIYISSDQVYPDVPGPHAEDSANPVNVYGRSKMAGEEAALSRPGTLVLRTNIFGASKTPGRKSLSDFVVDSLIEKRQVTFFTDILFSPLHMETLGDLMARCIEKTLSGCYNLGSRDGMSKADFALAVASMKGLPTATTRLQASSASLSQRAPRPRDMRLCVTLIENALGLKMPTLMEEIQKL